MLIPLPTRPSPGPFICLFIQDSSLAEGLFSFRSFLSVCLGVCLPSMYELLEFQDCLESSFHPVQPAQYLETLETHHMFIA